MKSELYRDIPEHEHTHSLYVHCLSCHTWGIDMPTRFINAGTCGNCGTAHVVKYYPSCCIVADRRAAEASAIDIEAGESAALLENKRLRDALTEIAVMDYRGDLPPGVLIARRALNKSWGT